MDAAGSPRVPTPRSDHILRTVRRPARSLGQADPVDAGIIERHRTPGWPPRVRYILTSQGRALEPVARSMWERGTARRDALDQTPDP
ncbi:winged helix-turn-helix transcriptional regulator [Streptomyces sp. NPDC054804]